MSRQKLGTDYLLENPQSMLDAYIRLGFGCRLRDGEGIEWSYRDIADANGTKQLAFSDFVDWCMMRQMQPRQLALELQC